MGSRIPNFKNKFRILNSGVYFGDQHKTYLPGTVHSIVRAHLIACLPDKNSSKYERSVVL